MATVVGLLGLMVSAAVSAQSESSGIYNTVKLKLAAGQQVVGGTVTSSDPNIYCAMANSGFDFVWIEMQHSPLTYQEVGRMIWACRGAPAIPFVRIPDATAGDIFFQAPDDAYFIRAGVRESLRRAPAGVAPVEGAGD
jgi:4-hydroxy-2-oxoheptanedioate aldolase